MSAGFCDSQFITEVYPFDKKSQQVLKMNPNLNGTDPVSSCHNTQNSATLALKDSHVVLELALPLLSTLCPNYLSPESNVMLAPLAVGKPLPPCLSGPAPRSPFRGGAQQSCILPAPMPCCRASFHVDVLIQM